MNFQDAELAYFRSVLGVSGGSYADLKSQYYEAKAKGTAPGDPVSISNVTGLQTILTDLTDRIEALEAAAT